MGPNIIPILPILITEKPAPCQSGHWHVGANTSYIPVPATGLAAWNGARTNCMTATPSSNQNNANVYYDSGLPPPCSGGQFSISIVGGAMISTNGTSINSCNTTNAVCQFGASDKIYANAGGISFISNGYNINTGACCQHEPFAVTSHIAWSL